MGTSTKKTELQKFTFKDTGIWVWVRKVSPFLALEVRRAFPAPQPPIEAVDYGDGVTKFEANKSHPDYLKAVSENEEFIGEKLQTLIINMGVVLDLSDEQKEEVKALKENMKELTGVELKGSDKYLYIMCIAMGTSEDQNDLVNAVMRRTQPTEVAIAEAITNFPGDV